MLLTETYFDNVVDTGTNDFDTQLAVFEYPYSSTWPSLFVCILIWQQCSGSPIYWNPKKTQHEKKKEKEKKTALSSKTKTSRHSWACCCRNNLKCILSVSFTAFRQNFLTWKPLLIPTLEIARNLNASNGSYSVPVTVTHGRAPI